MSRVEGQVTRDEGRGTRVGGGGGKDEGRGGRGKARESREEGMSGAKISFGSVLTHPDDRGRKDAFKLIHVGYNQIKQFPGLLISPKLLKSPLAHILSLVTRHPTLVPL